ncbi:UDP-glucosyltransferase 2 [Diabrotica virgifera virgifera]|uniref:UDP-glucuronosyltransferase n=1 Tax=Diabrotica virgifera virgifera TaxID=50390 RepID=A0A6P7FHM4_DIAVI|nr:UDP-glucosyltransferase 2 [Diabrotica virgifera virgifera]
MKQVTLIFLFAGLLAAESANILGIFVAQGRSQFLLGERLLGELARRGHNVTLLGKFVPQEKHENLHLIRVNLMEENSFDFLSWETQNDFEHVKAIHDKWLKITEGLFDEQLVKDLINSNSTFDMVIFESFGSEAAMGFAKHFNASLVVFNSLAMNEWCSNLIGNVRIPSITPYSLTQKTSSMTFYERLTNTLLFLYDKYYKEYVYYPQQQKILKQHFGNEMDLHEVMTSTSFLLLNSHPLTTEPSLLTSAAVEIGGFHVSTRKLPNDIKKFLDDAKHGAVLISFGTNIDMKTFSNNTIESLLRAIQNLPQRFIWKFDALQVPNKPDNLLISKWLPQSDILAHPNVVAFVSHSGLISITEAVHHGVPLVVVPIFGDQHMNALRAVEKGIAVKIEFSKLDGDTLLGGVQKIINDNQYQKNAKEISKMFRDRPVHPMDLAVHTIEYVLKFNPERHFRSPALDLSWFQLYLLDIVFVVIVVTMLITKIAKRDVRNKKVKAS